VITAARDELAAWLATIGHTVERTVPEEVAPPAYIIQPADPFVVDDDPDATFSEPYVIAFDVVALVRLDDEHSNKYASDQLDAMLDDLLDALRESSWTLGSMGQPGPLFTTEWVCHGQRITVRRPVAP
jgi:hypothetical protein